MYDKNDIFDIAKEQIYGWRQEMQVEYRITSIAIVES